MDRTKFTERWKQMRARTRAMIESANGEILDRRPSELVRSPREIAAHLVACQSTVMTGLATGEFPWKADNERFGAMSIEAMLETARDLDALLVQMIESAEESWFEHVPGKYNLSHESWLWETLDHEIHHVGQLATIIRMSGGEPARIFG